MNNTLMNKLNKIDNKNNKIQSKKQKNTFYQQTKMGNELCNVAQQTEFKRRMQNLCGPGENKNFDQNLKSLHFSENDSPKDNIYKEDEVKENSVDSFSATFSDNHQFLKKQQHALSLIKEQSNQTIDPSQIKPQVRDDKQEATSPMRKAKIDLNQIYLKHVKSNNQEGNLNYQPISVPFSVIKMVLNKNLLNLLVQQQKILEKYNKDQSSFKLYKGGWYGNIISQNFGIFLNKDYFYEGYFLQNQGQFKPNSNGTYITEKSKYVGEFKDGKPNGKGKYVENTNDSSKNVTTFQGDWQNGSLIKGIIENHLLRYEGNLLNRKPHGQGKMYLKKSNSSYSGEFKNGQFHGQHSLYETTGYSYAGDFINGKKNGRGVLLQKSALLQSSKGRIKKQERYEGIWKQDKLQQLTSTKTPN